MSSRTLFISRLMGLYLLCASLTMFTHKQGIVQMEDTMVHNPAFLYLAGVIALGAGLAVVLGHNVWHGGALPVTVTVTGWVMLLKGFLLMLPGLTAAFWESLRYEQLYYLYASIAFALGAYLTLAGFLAAWHVSHPGHQH